MYSTLIVARMAPESATEVARIFEEFDRTELPGQMGTRRRELFAYRGLYFHLQDFDGPDGAGNIEEAKSSPLFTAISADLKPYIGAYDPATWKSPKDAMAERFYHWSAR
ncbi:TcmI family type II polyketide cyclase [Krasilnikovia sp. MM14-A1004]|uniref:TcmI family type II polyketide cyclase n=1 Tax=Krasilnikovia sp. MM14-A1004 TaxID=3373541 RepID=UPI00399D1D8F